MILHFISEQLCKKAKCLGKGDISNLVYKIELAFADFEENLYLPAFSINEDYLVFIYIRIGGYQAEIFFSVWPVTNIDIRGLVCYPLSMKSIRDEDWGWRYSVYANESSHNRKGSRIQRGSLYGIIERENYNKPKLENSRRPGCPEEKVKAIEEALKHFKMI